MKSTTTHLHKHTRYIHIHIAIHTHTQPSDPGPQSWPSHSREVNTGDAQRHSSMQCKKHNEKHDKYADTRQTGRPVCPLTRAGQAPRLETPPRPEWTRRPRDAHNEKICGYFCSFAVPCVPFCGAEQWCACVGSLGVILRGGAIFAKRWVLWRGNGVGWLRAWVYCLARLSFGGQALLARVTRCRSKV